MRAAIDRKEMESFIRWYGRFIKRVPEIKTDAIRAGGKVLEQEVREQVDRQGVSDASGRVKGWQKMHLGSGGGYAAVRPDNVWTNSVWHGNRVLSGKLTKWLESGHKVRLPSGKNAGYIPRIKNSVLITGGAVVKGRLFYSWARSTGAKKALDAAARELDRITDEWEWD